MKAGQHECESPIGGGGFVWRVIGAAGVACLLVMFFLVIRWMDSRRTPQQTIRVVDTIEPMALPAPAPPVEVAALEPPPPPPPVKPELEVSVESPSPPVPSSSVMRLDLSMRAADFEWEADPAPSPAIRQTPRSPTLGPSEPPSPRAPTVSPQLKSVYSAGELDSRPKLLNQPRATYPSELRRRGVKEGRVLLEVSVSTAGRVTVRKVLSTSHPEFAEMARTVAARARFTVPKKNGRPVTAIYNWPLVLRP